MTVMKENPKFWPTPVILVLGRPRQDELQLGCGDLVSKPNQNKSWEGFLSFRGLNLEVKSAVGCRQQQFYLKVWSEVPELLHRHYRHCSVGPLSLRQERKEFEK